MQLDPGLQAWYAFFRGPGTENYPRGAIEPGPYSNFPQGCRRYLCISAGSTQRLLD